MDVFDPSPPNQQLRYKTIVKLMSEESCATDPCNIAMTDYSSLESSEGDYTDCEIENDYYLFQNVRKIQRRKRRKMPIEEYRKTKERKKLLDYVSESSSGEDEDYLYPSSAFSEVTVQYYSKVSLKLF